MRFSVPTARLFRSVVSASQARREGLVVRELCPELALGLAWETDRGLRYLTHDMARRLGRKLESWWSLAPEGVDVPWILDRRETDSGAVLWLYRYGHARVCDLLLDLDARAEALPQKWYDPVLGLLVAAPTRSSLYVHLLGTTEGPASVQQAILELAVRAQAGFQTRPRRPCSPDIDEILPHPERLDPSVYWWWRGRLTRLPVELDLEAEQVVLRPPASFVEAVLDRV